MFWTFSFVKFLIIINWDFFYLFIFLQQKNIPTSRKSHHFLTPTDAHIQLKLCQLTTPPVQTRWMGWLLLSRALLVDSVSGWVFSWSVVHRSTGTITVFAAAGCCVYAAYCTHLIIPKTVPPRWRAQLRRSTAGTTLDEWLLNRCRGVSDKETPADLVQASCLVYSWC